jgi:hypothetical protein
MTDLAATPSPPPRSPLSLPALRELYFKPSRFFSRGTELMKRPEAVIVGWLVGISNALDRIDINMLRADVGSSPAATETIADAPWTFFWLSVLLVGAVGGWIFWYVGGWWYRVRLRWSRAYEPSHELARAVNAYQVLVMAVPMILAVLVQTFFYGNYAEAWRSEEMWSSVVLLFIPWSCVTSYVAATTAFKALRARAALWFIAVPLVFYMILMVGLAGLYVMMGGAE